MPKGIRHLLSILCEEFDNSPYKWSLVFVFFTLYNFFLTDSHCTVKSLQNESLGWITTLRGLVSRMPNWHVLLEVYSVLPPAKSLQKEEGVCIKRLY